MPPRVKLCGSLGRAPRGARGCVRHRAWQQKIWKPEELHIARWHSPASFAFSALAKTVGGFLTRFHALTKFRFLFPPLCLVRLAAVPRRPRSPAAPQPQRVGNKGRERGPSWWPFTGFEFPWLRSPRSFFLSFFMGFGGFFLVWVCGAVNCFSAGNSCYYLSFITSAEGTFSISPWPHPLNEEGLSGAAAFLSNFSIALYCRS